MERKVNVPARRGRSWIGATCIADARSGVKKRLGRIKKLPDVKDHEEISLGREKLGTHHLTARG